jgi:hypothetical protein
MIPLVPMQMDIEDLRDTAFVLSRQSLHETEPPHPLEWGHLIFPVIA